MTTRTSKGCPVPRCPLVGASAHRRKYEQLERSQGRHAADEWDRRHATFMECDDCGRSDGTHDPTVKH